MRLGTTFVTNIDKTLVDFTNQYTQVDVFPTEEIFNWEFWHGLNEDEEENNYMKLLKEEENRDLQGNKNMFTMQDSF